MTDKSVRPTDKYSDGKTFSKEAITDKDIGKETDKSTDKKFDPKEKDHKSSASGDKEKMEYDKKSSIEFPVEKRT